jgi:hypothetical protein
MIPLQQPRLTKFVCNLVFILHAAETKTTHKFLLTEVETNKLPPAAAAAAQGR